LLHLIILVQHSDLPYSSSSCL